jgi:hypothetical protein
MRRWSLAAFSTVLASATVGCDEGPGRTPGSMSAGIGSVGGDSSSGDADPTKGDAPEGTTGDAPDGNSGDGEPMDDAEGARFDVGTDDEATGALPEEGCTKVDFLFIIDNSPSMGPEQEALVGSFPGFMEAISTTLNADSDYHIMVTDTDAGDRCESSCSDSLCTDPVAGDYACTADFDTCDHSIGAGKVHPAGEGASNELCAITGGNRYITADEVDLTGTFECIATVGLAGHPSERPMDALVSAVSDPMNAAGSCNDGFLRGDAILVVTFISDDPNYEDAGVPQDWYDAVVAAKNGDPNAIVMLGMTTAWDGCGNNDKPNRGAHWVEFLEMWGDRGLHGSVCETDFTPFFQQAIDIIDVTCDEFNPPA